MFSSHNWNFMFALMVTVGISHTVLASEGSGAGPGNGGDGIRMGNKIYVLDLIEAGVEEAPFFNQNITILPDLEERVGVALFKFPEITSKVAQKLSEVAAVSPVTALLFLRAIEHYSFVLTQGPLVDIPDEDSVLQWTQGELVQLAIRRNSTISIDRGFWKEMSPEQKTALIFHEIVYATIKPHCEEIYRGDREFESCKQSSPRAREINGFMFSEAFSRGIRGFRNIAKGDLFVTEGTTRIPYDDTNLVCIGLNKIGAYADGYYIPASFFRERRYIYGFEEMTITGNDAEQIRRTAEKFCSHANQKSQFKSRLVFSCKRITGLPEFQNYQEYNRETETYVTKTWFGFSQTEVGYSGDGLSFTIATTPTLLQESKEQCTNDLINELTRLTYLFSLSSDF